MSLIRGSVPAGILFRRTRFVCFGYLPMREKGHCKVERFVNYNMNKKGYIPLIYLYK